MNNKNIRYNSGEIVSYYSKSRTKWNEFYPSERWVFERISMERSLGSILDVGCACGGLGMALNERFSIESYTGVDVNKDAILWAKQCCKLTVPSRFMIEDILNTKDVDFFDLVVSLSCADWNVETDSIIDKCWKHVKDGGYLVMSLRLTNLSGVNDIERSYQMINFSGKEVIPEKANYVVFNFKDALQKLMRLHPRLIGAYGYWGIPSQTACTPFKKLVFSVFYIKKEDNFEENEDIMTELHLPSQLFI